MNDRPGTIPDALICRWRDCTARTAPEAVRMTPEELDRDPAGSRKVPLCARHRNLLTFAQDHKADLAIRFEATNDGLPVTLWVDAP
jgi:hypothetical protein